MVAVLIRCNKHKKIQREAFEQDKQAKIAQAIVSGALAIIQALATLGPIGGAIAAIGIGKSSVMMSILEGVKTVNPEKKVLYVSAEMTAVDMLDPDEFMKYYPGLFNKVEFMFASDYIDNEEGPSFTQALDELLNRGYDMVVLDSMAEVQSIVQSDMGLASGRLAETYLLNQMAKHTNSPEYYTAFLLIQQVNKGGEFVGSNRLKHMITAHLTIKWSEEKKKYMEFTKNRRGEVKRRLFFKLGKGVEYDTAKFEEEMHLEEILSKETPIVEELTSAEFEELFRNTAVGSSEEGELEFDEIED